MLPSAPQAQAIDQLLPSFGPVTPTSIQGWGGHQAPRTGVPRLSTPAFPPWPGVGVSRGIRGPPLQMEPALPGGRGDRDLLEATSGEPPWRPRGEEERVWEDRLWGDNSVRQGPSLWCESPEVCGRRDSRDVRENPVTHFSFSTNSLLQAQCCPVDRQEKEPFPILTELPPPRHHCLKLTLRGCTTEAKKYIPCGPWRPLKKGPPGPIPDSGSFWNFLWLREGPLPIPVNTTPNQESRLLKAALISDRDKC